MILFMLCVQSTSVKRTCSNTTLKLLNTQNEQVRNAIKFQFNKFCQKELTRLQRNYNLKGFKSKTVLVKETVNTLEEGFQNIVFASKGIKKMGKFIKNGKEIINSETTFNQIYDLLC